MKRHPVISFSIGLIVSGIVLGLLFLLDALLRFRLAGGETLGQIEGQQTAQLIETVVVTIVAAMTSLFFFRAGRKFTAYGISVLPLIALLIVGVFYLESLNYHTKFDKTIWEREEWKPLKMATTLVKEKKLIGLTRQEVKEMLGQGFEEHREGDTDIDAIKYCVEKDWTLTVYFQKDKVVDTELRLPRLCV